MSQRRSFYRKVGYAVAIAVLLIPLSMLSRPAINNKDIAEDQADQGGKLAQLRTEYKLSQTNLGEIDPASETMKFATLGLRGVASMMLWQKANEYKMKEDWSNFEATLNQLIKLQPNYISVWQHQAWNVSYNLSVEFDDYRDRYYYVMRGIDFLEEGIKHNEEHPVLLSDLGWFVGQKIGRADEHKEYRRLFREDTDYHPEDRVGRDRDNWQVSRQWYLRAHDAVNVLGKPLLTAKGKAKGELLFYNHAPMSLMNYGEAIEEEGVFGEEALRAWDQAGFRWYIEEEPNIAYGNRLIPHSTGMRFRLNDLEMVQAKLESLLESLEALAPGLREKMRKERLAKLPKQQRDALEIPVHQRNEEQYGLAGQAEGASFVSHLDLAKRIQEDNPKQGAEAIRLARAADKAELRSHRISSYRDIVNFSYWQTRSQFEKTENALVAREKTIEADQAHEEADFEKAKALYEESFDRWHAVFEEFPTVATHGVTGDDVLDVVVRYNELLEEMEIPLADDFVLWYIIEEHDQEGNFRDLQEARHARLAGQSSATPEEEKKPDSAEQPNEKEDSDKAKEKKEAEDKKPNPEDQKEDKAKPSESEEKPSSETSDKVEEKQEVANEDAEEETEKDMKEVPEEDTQKQDDKKEEPKPGALRAA